VRRLWELPPEYREAIVLQVLFGYSQAEIADLLDVPVSTVNNRLYRARQFLTRRASVQARTAP